MDQPFEYDKYQPTSRNPPLLQPELAKKLLNELSTRTRAIMQAPYDPARWLARARTCVQLGYPELAAGDTSKTIMLCDSILACQDIRTSHLLGIHRGFRMVSEDDGLSDTRGSWQNLVRDHTKEITVLRSLSSSIQEDLLCGSAQDSVKYVPRQYPWLHQRHLTRSDSLLECINEEIYEACSEHYCRCERKALPADDESKEAENLGIFANVDIPKGTWILLDDQGFTRSRGEHGRSMLAGIVDGLSLSTTEDSTNINTGKKRSLIAHCIETRSEHPLDSQILARLKPTFHRRSTRRFHLTDITHANQVLQSSGIDIYANLHYDTWVLFTIESRLRNNEFSDPHTSTLSPLFCLFNHSCEPNVKWTSSRSGKGIKLCTLRAVRKDEQLFVCYDFTLEHESLEARQARLNAWIDGRCRCKKCLVEKAQGTNGDSVASWDTEERPVLPEDLEKVKSIPLLQAA